MDALKYLNNCKVLVHPANFVIAVSSQIDFIPNDCFAVIRNQKETTLVIENDRFKESEFKKFEPGWKLLTFEIELPFDLVGFLAIIARQLADNGISIFVLSSYYTDHILVKKAALEDTRTTLESLGCQLRDESSNSFKD